MEEDERLNYYLEIGAVKLIGVDESGEFIFRITEEAETLAPDLYAAHSAHVDESLIELYKAGLVNITYDENLEATIEMSPEGHIRAKQMGLIEMNTEEGIPND